MPTALIIDDNSDIRSLLKRGLEMEGYEIHQAENGRVAQLKLATIPRPCIVLLDLMMPIMDGKEFLAWKNSEEEFADIDVLVISAMPTKKSELPGTIGYLKKPIDFDELFEYAERSCC